MAKDSTGTILLLGAVGVAVYGYTQGWFSQLFGVTAIPGTTTLDASQTAAIKAQLAALAAQGTNPPPTASPTPAAVPALGTTVTSAGQVAAQVAAKDPYILPDATTWGAYSVTPPAGYSNFNLSDKGNVLLRQDVASLANLQVGATGNPIALTDLQGLMTTKGLSGGLGDYRRHLYSRTGRA